MKTSHSLSLFQKHLFAVVALLLALWGMNTQSAHAKTKLVVWGLQSSAESAGSVEAG